MLCIRVLTVKVDLFEHGLQLAVVDALTERVHHVPHLGHADVAIFVPVEKGEGKLQF